MAFESQTAFEADTRSSVDMENEKELLRMGSERRDKDEKEEGQRKNRKQIRFDPKQIGQRIF